MPPALHRGRVLLEGGSAAPWLHRRRPPSGAGSEVPGTHARTPALVGRAPEQPPGSALDQVADCTLPVGRVLPVPERQGQHAGVIPTGLCLLGERGRQHAPRRHGLRDHQGDRGGDAKEGAHRQFHPPEVHDAADAGQLREIDQGGRRAGSARHTVRDALQVGRQAVIAGHEGTGLRRRSARVEGRSAPAAYASAVHPGTGPRAAPGRQSRQCRRRRPGR